MPLPSHLSQTLFLRLAIFLLHSLYSSLPLHRALCPLRFLNYHFPLLISSPHCSIPLMLWYCILQIPPAPACFYLSPSERISQQQIFKSFPWMWQSNLKVTQSIQKHMNKTFEWYLGICCLLQPGELSQYQYTLIIKTASICKISKKYYMGSWMNYV